MLSFGSKWMREAWELSWIWHLFTALLSAFLNHMIGLTNLLDSWVIKIKSLWAFAHVVRRDHVNSTRNAAQAVRTCDRFVKISRVDYQTWPTHLFEKCTRCVKVCGLFFLVVLSRCWLPRQTNSDHTVNKINSKLLFMDVIVSSLALTFGDEFLCKGLLPNSWSSDFIFHSCPQYIEL